MVVTISGVWPELKLRKSTKTVISSRLKFNSRLEFAREASIVCRNLFQLCSDSNNDQSSDLGII